MNKEIKLCKCGCGSIANPGRDYIIGHYWKGVKHSDKTREKMVEASKKRWEYPKEHEKASETVKKRFEENPVSDITREKHSEALIKYYEENSVSDTTKEKISATRQHIPYEEWESFASNQKYCPAFDEPCRESNREKYSRRCFLTGLPEKENITKNGNQWKLAVHHYDMDKQQGCSGKRWKLVPICLEWHSKVHTELWEARITWLLENVWS